MKKTQFVANRKQAKKDFLALMHKIGATPLTESEYDKSHLAHAIHEKGCTLRVGYCESDYGDWLACKWADDMEKVSAAKLPYNNPYSGKWNHHGNDGVQSVAIFAAAISNFGK